ncbi:MAG: hypothetical protein RBR22_05090 [Desulfuromonas sp.]|nr:hypothetical protein [Desulfuromonas sp.]
MTSHLFYLQDSLSVVPVGDDQVQVVVTLPVEYLTQYTRLLDSLTGFIDVLKREDKLSRLKLKSDNLKFHDQARKNLNQYHQRLVAAYDLYTAKGLNRNAAIKQISVEIRAEQHPWSSPDLVRHSLINAGRSGRVGRPRGVK